MTKAYLFSWNSVSSNWDEERIYTEYINTGKFFTSWRTSRKKIEVGSRAYLIKLSSEPKGIIASGRVASIPVKLEEAERLHLVDLEMDLFLDFDSNVILHQDELKELNQRLKIDMNWSPQNSGTEIPEALADEIDVALKNLKEVSGQFENLEFVDGDEVEKNNTELFEGAAYDVTLTRYERNPEARQKCLDHYGYDCFVCDFNFEKSYGSLGKKFIHVHHLNPIAEAKEEYVIDWLRDLRPVCPNCHAMAHKQNPPISIEKLREIIKSFRS